MLTEKYTIGSAIKLIRSLRGVTCSQLRRKTGCLFLNIYEETDEEISSQDLQKIADALGVPRSFFKLLATDPATTNVEQMITDLQHAVVDSIIKGEMDKLK